MKRPDISICHKSLTVQIRLMDCQQTGGGWVGGSLLLYTRMKPGCSKSRDRMD